MYLVRARRSRCVCVCRCLGACLCVGARVCEPHGKRRCGRNSQAHRYQTVLNNVCSTAHTCVQEQIYFGLGIFFAIVCLLGILQYAVWAGIKGSRCIPLPASSTAGPNASDKKKDEDDLISIETGSSARAGSNSDGDNGGTFESVVVVGGTDSVETPIGKGGSGPNASQRPTGAGCASDPGNDHSSVHVSSSDASSLHSEGVSTATNAL